MSVQVQCQCGETFLAPEKAGARVKCPHCGVKFALRELHEAGDDDLTPLPPDRDPQSPIAPLNLPAAPLAPSVTTPANSPVGVLDNPLARRRQSQQEPSSSVQSALLIGVLAATALVFAALGYNAYVRDRGASGAQAASGEQWREISSTAGRFAVLFPGDVKTSEGRRPFGDTEAPFISAEAVAPDDTVLEIVSYEVEPPFGAGERDQMLDDFCNRLADEYNLFTRRTITLEGYKGRELAYEQRIDALSDIVRMRVYSAGARFLTLTTRRINNSSHSQASDKFFDSLKILDPPPGV